MNKELETLKRAILKDEARYGNGVCSLTYAFEQMDKAYEIGKKEIQNRKKKKVENE